VLYHIDLLPKVQKLPAINVKLQIIQSYQNYGITKKTMVMVIEYMGIVYSFVFFSSIFQNVPWSHEACPGHDSPPTSCASL